MKGKNLKTILLKYGITVFIGGLMAYSVISSYGLAAAQTDAEIYRILADAFTIPGVVILLCGVLVAIANEGTFEGLSYAVTYAFKMLIPGTGKTHEKFGDYVARRREKGGVKGYGFLFVVGGVFMAIAVVFIALFYSVY